MRTGRIFPVTAAFLAVGFCVGAGYAGTYTVTLTAPPNTVWNDFHISTEWWCEPDFVRPNPISASTPPVRNVVVQEDSTYIDNITGDVDQQKGGTLRLTVNTQADSWDWDACVYYLTDSGARIPGTGGTIEPTVANGVAMSASGGIAFVSAATQSGATITEMLYASSDVLYATPGDLENAGILAAVTPTNSSPQSTPTEVYTSPAAGKYQYSRTRFSDGGVYYGDTVPEPGMLSLVMLGLAFSTRRFRRA